MPVNKEINFIVTSDPNNGAINVTSDGARFDVLLETPFHIPVNASNVTLEVQAATIWWTTPNIITGVNDRFYLDDNGTPRNITLGQGLYDRVNLGAAINTQLVNSGGADGLITISEDTATNKIILTANAVAQTIDFTQADTFRDILGFNSQTLGPNVASPFNWIGTNTARFNVVNYYLVGSSLVGSRGLRFNNIYRGIIAQVLIDERPGSQITFAPYNPAKTNVNHLRGTRISKITMSLMSDTGSLVNTGGEYWSVRLVIRFSIPVDVDLEE